MNNILVSKILNKMIRNTKCANTTLKVRVLSGLTIDKSIKK